MSSQEIKEQLRRIFVVMPSVKKWIEQTDEPNKTLDAWIAMIESCDISDVTHIVDEVVGGRLEPIGQWEKPDVLPRFLRREAAARRSRREDKQNQQQKYHSSSRGAMAYVRNTKTGNIAIYVGTLVKEKRLEEDQSSEMLDELMDWDKGKAPTPLWLVDGKVDLSRLEQDHAADN